MVDVATIEDRLPVLHVEVHRGIEALAPRTRIDPAIGFHGKLRCVFVRPVEEGLIDAVMDNCHRGEDGELEFGAIVQDIVWQPNGRTDPVLRIRERWAGQRCCHKPSSADIVRTSGRRLTLTASQASNASLGRASLSKPLMWPSQSELPTTQVSSSPPGAGHDHCS